MSKEQYIFPPERSQAAGEGLTEFLEELPTGEKESLKSYRNAINWPDSKDQIKIKGFLRKVFTAHDSVGVADIEEISRIASESPDRQLKQAASLALHVQAEYRVVGYDSLSSEDFGRLNGSLLGSKKPLFGSADHPELVRNLHELELAVSEVRKEHPAIKGVLVGGSLVKGYADSKSDLDYILFTDGSIESAEMKSIEQGIKDRLTTTGVIVCKFYFKDFLRLESIFHQGYMKNLVAEKYPDNEQWAKSATDIDKFAIYEVLFTGLYSGDRRELEKQQRKFLESVTEEDWEAFRQYVYENQIIDPKKRDKFNIPVKAKPSIAIGVLLNRLPPPLAEARKYFEERSMKENRIRDKQPSN